MAYIDYEETCSSCGGRGYSESSCYACTGGRGGQYEYCSMCGSTGVIKSTCNACGGSGRVRNSRWVDDKSNNSSPSESGYTPSSGGHSPSRANSSYNKAIDLYNEGVELLNRKDYEGAIAKFTISLNLTDDPDTCVKRGFAYIKLENWECAIADLNRAISQKNRLEDSKPSYVYCLRGLAYNSSVNFDSPNYQEVVEQAITDYTTAITLGYVFDYSWGVEAYYVRGMSYFRIEKRDKAIADFKTCAEFGDDMSKNFLKTMFEIDYEVSAETFNTRGVEAYKAKSYELAAKLYGKAADMGFSFSQSNLGYLYMHGLGVEKNPAKAIELTQKAVEQNNSHALWNMGIYYRDGLGVKQNKKLAKEFFKKAVDLGNEEAKKSLEELKKDMKSNRGCIFWGVIVVVVISFVYGVHQCTTGGFSSFTDTETELVTATVTAKTLNLRAEASNNAKVVKSLKKGDILTITGEAVNGWAPVTYNGDEGWVYLGYVEINDESQSSTPAASNNSKKDELQSPAQTVSSKFKAGDVVYAEGSNAIYLAKIVKVLSDDRASIIFYDQTTESDTKVYLFDEIVKTHKAEGNWYIGKSGDCEILGSEGNNLRVRFTETGETETVEKKYIVFKKQ